MPRPRSFDEDALLDAAIELFWVRGYAAASLAQLSAASGVANGSLYQAYGSKRALFLLAFRRYCAGRVAVVTAAFDRRDASGHGVARAVAAYFDAIIDDCAAHPDRRGCLLINTVSELGTDPEVTRIAADAVAGMEAAVHRALAEETADGADPAELALSAAQVVALSQAMIQLSRMGRDTAELRRLGDHAAVATGRALAAA